MTKSPRIAWFSPLNTEAIPGLSVGAYVTDTLYPLLSSRCDIDLYQDGFSKYKGKETRHYLSAFRAHREDPYDLFFYQLEDLRLSYFTRFHLGLMPGVTLFHDLLLTDDGPEPILNSAWTETARKYLDPLTPWPDREREYKKNSKMALREAGLSFVSLFSNELALDQYRRTVEQTVGGDGYLLPLPVSRELPLHVPATARRSVAFCGSPRIEHRAHKVLQAIAECPTTLSLLWLVEEGDKLQAEDLLREFGVRNAEVVGGKSPSAWQSLLCRADIAVHTLFSVFGQPGPYLQMSLMAGLPCIVTRFGSTEYLPETVVFKVEAGDAEATEIREVLSAIASGKVYFSHELARSFAIENFSADIIASELFSIFTRSGSHLHSCYSRWEELEKSARKAVIGENLLAFDLMGRAHIEEVYRELNW